MCRTGTRSIAAAGIGDRIATRTTATGTAIHSTTGTAIGVIADIDMTIAAGNTRRAAGARTTSTAVTARAVGDATTVATAKGSMTIDIDAVAISTGARGGRGEAVTPITTIGTIAAQSTGATSGIGLYPS